MNCMLIKAERATEQAKGESEGGPLTHVCAAAGRTRMNATCLTDFISIFAIQPIQDAGGWFPP